MFWSFEPQEIFNFYKLWFGIRKFLKWCAQIVLVGKTVIFNWCALSPRSVCFNSKSRYEVVPPRVFYGQYFYLLVICPLKFIYLLQIIFILLAHGTNWNFQLLPIFFINCCRNYEKITHKMRSSENEKTIKFFLLFFDPAYFPYLLLKWKCTRNLKITMVYLHSHTFSFESHFVTFIFIKKVHIECISWVKGVSIAQSSVTIKWRRRNFKLCFCWSEMWPLMDCLVHCIRLIISLHFITMIFKLNAHIKNKWKINSTPLLGSSGVHVHEERERERGYAI